MLIYFNQQKLHKGNLALGKKKKKLYTVINQVIQSSGKAIICNCRQSKSRSTVTSSLCFLVIYAHPVACWCCFLIFPTSDFSTFGMSFPSVHDSHSVFPSNPPPLLLLRVYFLPHSCCCCCLAACSNNRTTIPTPRPDTLAQPLREGKHLKNNCP